MPSLKPLTGLDDPNVKIPAAVTRAAAHADQIHQQAYNTQDPPADPNAAPPPDNPPPANPPADPPAPQPGEPGYEDSWKHRYDAMKGRFEKSEHDKIQLSDRLNRMETILANMQAAPPAPPPAPELRAASLVTDTERQEYGEEFLDVVARRAREAVQPELDARDAHIKELERELKGTTAAVVGDARDRMLASLDQQMPEWRSLNEKPGFLNWLRLHDTFSGAIRHALLTQAFERNDTARVLAFFNGYLREEEAVAPVTQQAAPVERPSLEKFAAPGRAKSAPATQPGSPADKPIITSAQISAFYADSAAGRYVGKEAEKDRLEKMIFSAQAEGRIR